MRIGLYGGAFNPPHIGHLKVMTHAMAVGNLDSLWVHPAWKHSFGKDMLPFEDRLRMTTLAIEQVFGMHSPVRVNSMEKALDITYTVDFVEFLVRNYTHAQFVMIIGPDNLECHSKWRRWDDITKMVELLVVPDQGPERSTLVRDSIRSGRIHEVEGMVPNSVLTEIRSKGFYLPEASISA